MNKIGAKQASVRNLAARGGIIAKPVLQLGHASLRRSEVVNSRGRATA